MNQTATPTAKRTFLPRRLLFALIWGALAAVCAMPTEASADERIWTGLVLATNSSAPKAAPAELSRVAARIERFFGYNQLELVGAATKTVDETSERWLVPSQNFWLCVKSTRTAEKMFLLELSIYQDKRCLVQTSAKLGPNSPLLIRGPMHARGQLIIMLQVQP